MIEGEFGESAAGDQSMQQHAEMAAASARRRIHFATENFMPGDSAQQARL
jgi:hypothetical protein